MMQKNVVKGCMALLLIGAMGISGCNSDDDDEDLGNWMTATTFDGVARSSASSFVIGNKGYVGTGFDGDDYLKDFWEFDFDGGYWVQKASLPGVERSSAAAFAIGNYGYLGTGYDGTNELSDFYKYDPAGNAWTQIANLGGSNNITRRKSIAFSSDTYGYVGCGYDGTNDKKDFWKYKPDTNTWEEMFGFGGNKRRDAITFKINDKVYVGTGKSNGVDLRDFWSFDLNSETWTKLHDIDENDDDNSLSYSIIRSNAVAFSLGNLGYVCQGTAYSTTWEYDPDTDLWEKKTSLEATSRQDATALSNGQRAYVLLGRSGNLYLDDMWEFKPFDEQVDND